MVVAVATTVFPQSQQSRFRFQLYSKEQGLKSTEIYSVIQDQPGYLWIGTTNGLHRFDGFSFTVFLPIPFDSTSLSESFVSCLCEDKSGNIWVGTTEHGLNKLNPRTGIVKRFIHNKNNKATLTDNSPTTLFCDASGNLWVGTAFGNVNVINPKTGLIKHVVLDKFGEVSPIRSIIQDKTGNIWVASTNQIYLINSLDKIDVINFEPSFALKLKTNHSILYKDSSNTIWLGSTGKLWKYKREENSFSNIPFTSSNLKTEIFAITSIKEELSGIFWIATNNGVFRFDQNTKTTTDIYSQPKFPNELNKILPRTLTIDKTGVVWIGYGLFGVLSIHTYNPNIKTFLEQSDFQDGLPNQYVRGLTEDKDNNLWIGTYSGLTQLDSSLNRFKHFPSLLKNSEGKVINQINALFMNKNNILWIGTDGGGLFSYSTITGKVIHQLGKGTKVNDERDHIVFEITPDRYGQLWVGTSEGGVVVLDSLGKFIKRYSKESRNAQLPDNQVRSILEDEMGDLWIGTFAGLCKLNPVSDELITYSKNEHEPSSLSDHFILSLYQDQQKRIWIGTRLGINIFDPKNNSFRYYTTANGLLNDVIVGFAGDLNGLVWVSSYGGLMAVNDSLKIKASYFEADGLQNDLFNTGATLLLRSGKIAFGGAHGLSIVTPQIVKSKPLFSSIVIQAFKQGDNPVTRAVSLHEKGFVTLEPNENSVRFEFAALDFQFSKGNIYSYKLEGLDQNWTTTFSRRSVTYTNLNAGDYIFHVKAAGRDGFWSENSATIELHVIPPVWKRWWFTPVIVLLIVLIVFTIYRSFYIKKLQIERMRLQISADLHDEIGSGLARISILSDIVEKNITTNESANLKKSLIEQTPGRIGIISRDLMESIQDVVWALDPKNDKAANVFERIQIYATQLAEENNISINIQTENLEKCKVGLNIKRAVLLIAKESLTNILHHANAKTISLLLRYDGRYLEMSITDDGVGFTEENLVRINGLHNMRRRATSADGDCFISSKSGEGTIINARFLIYNELKNYPNVRLRFKSLKSKFTS